MTVSDEKEGFSRRLRESLRRAGTPAEGPTEIAREFNLRYHGTPVTPQAVRKWLKAESLPSQDKIRALAFWLGVSPAWLRFGESDAKRRRVQAGVRQDVAAYRIDHTWLATKFEALSEPHKRMTIELVVALLRLESKQ